MKNLNFSEYYHLSESFKIDNKSISIKADDPEKGITLAQVFRDIKNNRKEILNVIKQNIRAQHFSPLVIAASMLLAGINTQNFINQNPEVLNYGIDKNIINKAAEFLNDNPKVLKLFQK